VRVEGNNKLVGFISAVPANIKIRDHTQRLVEINFLCVHKRLRSKRVAPVLIKEITRRVHLEGIFQAVYTAGVLLPKPVSVCRLVGQQHVVIFHCMSYECELFTVSTFSCKLFCFIVIFVEIVIV
jgi:hypothetical protein